MNLIYLLQIVLTCIMLAHTSYLDIKKREVDLKIWAIYAPLVIFFVFNYPHLNLFLYLYSVITVNLVMYFLYRFSMMGGADLILSIILSLSNATTYPIFFPSLSSEGFEPFLIILYGSIIILLSGLVNLFRNLKYTKGYSLMVRLNLAISAKRIKVKDFLSSKFLFPLTVIDEKGNQNIRTSFDVEEDDEEWRKLYREYVERGLIKEEDYIWVMWGVPVIPFFFIGYLISLVMGFPI
ncbi:peptidase A24 [Sulfolobus acidocaldarius SUSAZ]|nr:peptidase A24 [Sulfolobus acidocaldarius SUSAZ]